MKNKISKIFDDLFPLPRSIMGKGYSDSLDYLKKFIPFKIYKFKTGTKIYDWKIPKEWQIKKAFIEFNGKKILDYKNNNLHVVNYSSPINKKINLKDLKKRIFFLKDQPTAIPYVTSYYKKNWGFCIKYSKYRKLKKGIYKTVIDSKFINGYLKIGLANLKGKSNKIFLISSYLCHPSMANNELSGPLTMLILYNKIKQWKKRNLNYYFLINPETIGSIAFLNKFHKTLNKRLHSGIVLTCLGGPKKLISYKYSKEKNSTLDGIFQYFNRIKKVKVREFDPTDGSDERQYSSGKFSFPIGQVSRTIYDQYKEYHTSKDNKKFMNINQIISSANEIEKYLKLNDKIKRIHRFQPFCELQLGKRNLYPNINFKGYNKKEFSKSDLIKTINILTYADGKHTLFDIANKLNLNLKNVEKTANILIRKKLIYLK